MRKALHSSNAFHKGEIRLSFVAFSLHPKPLTGAAVMSSSLILPYPSALGLPSTTHLPFRSQALRLYPYLWSSGVSEGWKRSAFCQP